MEAPSASCGRSGPGAHASSAWRASVSTKPKAKPAVTAQWSSSPRVSAAPLAPIRCRLAGGAPPRAWWSSSRPCTATSGASSARRTGASGTPRWASRRRGVRAGQPLALGAGGGAGHALPGRRGGGQARALRARADPRRGGGPAQGLADVRRAGRRWSWTTRACASCTCRWASRTASACSATWPTCCTSRRPTTTGRRTGHRLGRPGRGHRMAAAGRRS